VRCRESTCVWVRARMWFFVCDAEREREREE